MGADNPYLMHVARGVMPAHESGLDCQIRVFQNGTTACGVAKCMTSYGPVTLTAKADLRVFQNLTQAAREIRKSLLSQAVELPTESSSPMVAKAALLRSQILARDPVALRKYAAIKARAAQGDRQAAAFMGLLFSSQSPGGAQFGSSGLPNYHRAGIMFGAVAPTRAAPMTTAQATRLRAVLTAAIARIPPARLSAAAKR